MHKPFSKCHTAQAAAPLIRGHWEIEKSMHWSFDMLMIDDQHRARKDHATANVAALRRIALSIIKANPAKGSNRGKFKKRAGTTTSLKRSFKAFQAMDRNRNGIPCLSEAKPFLDIKQFQAVDRGGDSLKSLCILFRPYPHLVGKKLFSTTFCRNVVPSEQNA